MECMLCNRKTTSLELFSSHAVHVMHLTVQSDAVCQCLRTKNDKYCNKGQIHVLKLTTNLKCASRICKETSALHPVLASPLVLKV